MKKHYDSPCGHAGVTVVDYGDGEVEIQTVVTDIGYRRRGVMRALMDEVLADADREGVILLLTVGQGYEAGMSYADLRAWYERLGFDGLGGNRMQRMPGVGEVDKALGRLKEAR